MSLTKYQYPPIDFLAEEAKIMQIQLKCSCGEGSCHEWAIIELQGVVEVQPGFQDQLQNLEIGRLCRSSQVSVPCPLISELSHLCFYFSFI